MPSLTAFFLLALMLTCGGGSSSFPPPTPKTRLRQAAATHNLNIGAAAGSAYLSDSSYAAILGSEFSQLQAENEMKFSLIHPEVST